MGVAWVRWPNFVILGPPKNFWTKSAIRFIFRSDIEDGASIHRDHKTTHKWAWSRDQISSFRDPLNNFWTNWAIHFKFGTQMDGGPRLRRESKLTRKWVWPVMWANFEIFHPPNNFWTKRAICFKFGTEMEDGPACIGSAQCLRLSERFFVGDDLSGTLHA